MVILEGWRYVSDRKMWTWACGVFGRRLLENADLIILPCSRVFQAENLVLTNVPNADELEQTSLRLYFEAWRQITEIIDDLLAGHHTDAEISGRSIVPIYDESTGRTIEDNQENIADYIRLSQPDLQLSYALMQQSQELSLKSIICRESPFLLLLGSDIRSWGSNKDFTDLRTIDAGDLVKVVNAISPTALDDRFVNIFNDFRRGRNKIIHLGQFKDRLDPIFLLDTLIEQYRNLYHKRIWIQDLKAFEGLHRHTVFTSAHISDQNSALQRYISVEAATTAAQRRFLLGASKSSRLYRCHECHSGDYMSFDAGSGLTLEIEPKSRKSKCLICLQSFVIIYKNCTYCEEGDAFIDFGGDDDVCCYCGEVWNYRHF